MFQSYFIAAFESHLIAYIQTRSINVNRLKEIMKKTPTAKMVTILKDHQILQTACEHGDTEVISTVLEPLSLENRLSILQAGNPPPLFYAARNGQSDTGEALLSLLTDHQKLVLMQARSNSRSVFDEATMRGYKTTAALLRKCQEVAGKFSWLLTSVRSCDTLINLS